MTNYYPKLAFAVAAAACGLTVMSAAPFWAKVATACVAAAVAVWVALLERRQ